MRKKEKDNPYKNSFDGFDKLFNITSMDEQGTAHVPKGVKDAIIKLQEIARKHRMALSEIDDANLEMQQEWIIAEPQVYVARTIDKKTDKAYFTAKTFWPLKNGKKKEIKIYLGRAEDFGNETLDIRAREIAKRKMSETLRRRKDAGEI